MPKRSIDINESSSSSSFFALRKKGKSAPRKRRVSKSYVKSGPRSRALSKSYIDRCILARKEKKLSVQAGNFTLTASTVATLPQKITLTPNVIDQGTNLNERIGNQIQLTRTHLNFSIAANDTYSNRVLVFVTKSKYNPGENVAVADYITMKRDSNAALQGVYTASGIVDTMLPWNTHSFQVLYEEIFIMAAGYAEEGSTDLVMRSVDLTKAFKKMQDFSTGTGGTNEQIYVWFVPIETATGYATVDWTYTQNFVDS